MRQRLIFEANKLTLYLGQLVNRRAKMAAVEMAAMRDALFHLRLALAWGAIIVICVGISIGSHVADYPHRWVVHWIALWLGAVAVICQLLVLCYAVERAAAPRLAAVQRGRWLTSGAYLTVLGVRLPQPAEGEQPPAAGDQPAVGVPQAHQG